MRLPSRGEFFSVAIMVLAVLAGIYICVSQTIAFIDFFFKWHTSS